MTRQATRDEAVLREMQRLLQLFSDRGWRDPGQTILDLARDFAAGRRNKRRRIEITRRCRAQNGISVADMLAALETIAPLAKET